MTDPNESEPMGPWPEDPADAGDALRPARTMPVTTVVNLWMGPGLTLLLLILAVASLSLIAVRIDLGAISAPVRLIVPFVLLGTAATSLCLSIVNRPVRGPEHTISTLSVLLPWIVVLSFFGPLPVIPLGISAVLCVAALAFARARKSDESDGVAAGGYRVPRSQLAGTMLWVAGAGLLAISAVVYIGWFVQALIDPAGLSQYFDTATATAEGVRLRDGTSASAIAAAIAGFYGNLLIGWLLFKLGRGLVARPAAPAPEATAPTTVLQSPFFRVVGGWFVINAALSLAVTALIGLDFSIKVFYLVHLSIAWITLCTWFFGRRGKDGMLILGVFVGVFSLLIVLGLDLAVSLVISR